MKNTVIPLAILTLAAGCMNLRSIKEDPAQGVVPESFSQISEKAFTNASWWTEFNSPELDQLISSALQENLSISQAASRLKQANAVADQRGADRTPSVTASASASKTERDKPLIEGRSTETESAELLLTAAYELDLWGRVAAQGKAAALDASASAEDLAAARQAVASETAASYMELLYTRGTIDLINSQLANLENILELIELRYRRSQATALDVLQQREQLAGIEALPPPLEAKEKVLLNKLNVLSGQVPGTELGLKERSIPNMPAIPDAGVPL